MSDDEISNWSDPRGAELPDEGPSGWARRRSRALEGVAGVMGIEKGGREIASVRRARDPERAPTVTVIGAGIAGLTAAHELAERGFRVQVVESTASRERAGEVEIGGMARSQWGRIKASLDELHPDLDDEEREKLDAEERSELDPREREFLRKMIAFTRRYWIQTEPAVDCDLTVLFEPGLPRFEHEWITAAAKEHGPLGDDFRTRVIEKLLGLTDGDDASLGNERVPASAYLTAYELLTRFVWEEEAASRLRTQLGMLKRPAKGEWHAAGDPGAVVGVRSGCRSWDRHDPESSDPLDAILADVRCALYGALLERRKRFLYNLSTKRFHTVAATRREHLVAWEHGAEQSAELRALEEARSKLAEGSSARHTLDAAITTRREEIARAAREAADPECACDEGEELIPSCAKEGFLRGDETIDPEADDFELAVLRAALAHVGETDLFSDSEHMGAAIETLRREIFLVEMRGHTSTEGKIDVNVAIGAARAEAAMNELFGDSSDRKDELVRKYVVATTCGESAPIASDATWRGRAKNRRAQLVVRERFLPGEHGFRFFPRHYKNLFALMKRIPLLDERGDETGFSTFDRLMPTERQSLGLEPRRGETRGRHVTLLRTLPKSLDEVRSAATEFLRETGATPSDVARFQLKMLRFMTTGRKRRWRDYEHYAWRDFVGLNGPLEVDPKSPPEWFDPELAPPGWGFSDAMRTQIEAAAQALLAYSVAEADTHSYGNFSAQTIVDQADPDRRVDFILDRPTSLAWFRPWKRWLEQLGVRFFHGTLQRITKDRAPVFEEGMPRPERGTRDRFEKDSDFYVLAVPLVPCARVLRASNLSLTGDSERDLRRTLAFYEGHVGSKSPLRAMSGLQLHFDRSVEWGGVHVYYPSSFWGLSAITQTHHWRVRARGQHGYRGLVSIDLSDISGCERYPDQPWRPFVLGRAPVSIAAGAHCQIERATPEGPAKKKQDGSPGLALPHPDFFHLDEGLRADGNESPGPDCPVVRNATPYLANLVGQFSSRPGLPDSTCPGEPPDIGYVVADGGWVVAGAHMATYTRMMTMEGSCESGMHAANAIIRAMNKAAYAAEPNREHRYDGVRELQLIQETRPANIEDDEIPDLRPLKVLDDALFDEGLPHLFSLLRAERVLLAIERGEATQKDLEEWLESARAMLDSVATRQAKDSLATVLGILAKHAPIDRGSKLRSMLSREHGDHVVERVLELLRGLIKPA